MKVIKSLNELNELDYAVTIGNFDGVHCGHQKVIRNIKDECENSNLKLVVVTFTPQLFYKKFILCIWVFK